MNIIVLNDFGYVEGGASQVALNSARALAARGHRVLLLCAVGPVAEDLHDVPGLSIKCLQLHEIAADPNRLRAMIHGLWNDQASHAFRQISSSWTPRETVVHLHTWTKALSSSVVRAALDAGYPVVLTMHDYFSVCPNGSFFVYPKKALCHLTPMSLACICTQCDSRNYLHKLWRVGRQWMQEHPGHLPTGLNDFISISDRSEELLRPYLPQAARVHRVPNPIAVQFGQQVDPEAHNTFSFVGRLSAEKGPRLLAEAAAHGGMKIRFIGDGPERSTLAALMPDAEFTGWLPAEAVFHAMRPSRALVLTSLWYETQGLVVTEAAAMGLPTIVPSESAAREWVDDGVTGLLFRHGDAEDLRRKMQYLQQNPDRAKAMGNAAYTRYWSHPVTMQSHCERLEAVYERILNEPMNTGT